MEKATSAIGTIAFLLFAGGAYFAMAHYAPTSPTVTTHMPVTVSETTGGGV